MVPIIGLSDQTHLTNFLGDKKAWQVYMTIGNILSQVRNRPVKITVLLLALLPVSPKLTGESTCVDEAQPQINGDALRAVFDLVFAPLPQVAQEGTVMDCADGKTPLCFPILSPLIADHGDHATLHRMGSRFCPRCEVSCKELEENPQKMYKVSDATSYREKALEHQPGEAAAIAQYFQQAGVTIGRNIVTGLHRVNPADLYKPDLLPNIYLGLFKLMMQWVQGFLKKHQRQQAFDDACKEIPPYPGFSIPKQAYREVTQ